MEQFVMILQRLYEQKFKLEVKKLDTFEQKPVSVPRKLNPNYKEFSIRTRSLKNDSVVDQILNSPRVKLSLTGTIYLDGRDTEVAFADFNFELKRKNVEFPDILHNNWCYRNESAKSNIQRCQKTKKGGTRFLSKSEKSKLQRLYRDGKAAYGSTKNLQKASGLPKKKVCAQ